MGKGQRGLTFGVHTAPNPPCLHVGSLSQMQEFRAFLAQFP